MTLTPTSRARALLMSWLSPQQLSEFSEDEKFWVTGSLGGSYCIRCDYHNFNVYSDTYRERVCFLPTDRDGLYLPIYDQVLAQKIMLECDERAAMNIAVRSTTCLDRMICAVVNWWASLLTWPMKRGREL